MSALSACVDFTCTETVRNPVPYLSGFRHAVLSKRFARHPSVDRGCLGRDHQTRDRKTILLRHESRDRLESRLAALLSRRVAGKVVRRPWHRAVVRAQQKPVLQLLEQL